MSAQNTQTKTGLVLGGGGSRGSYTIGVLSTLSAQKKTYNVVTGISIGALVGALYAQNDPDVISKWAQVFTQNSVAEGLFQFPNRMESEKMKKPDFDAFISSFQKGGPDISPLKQSFSALFDYPAFEKSGIDYACLAVNLSKNKPAVFTKKEMTEENAVDALLCSAAYFPAFSLYDLNGDYYADGGYLDATLGKQAIAMGAQDLTMVALKDPGVEIPFVQSQTSLFIRPILKLAYFLNFEKPVLERQIEQGRLEALKYMDLVPGYIYTFYPDDYFLLDSLSDLAKQVLEPLHINLTNDKLIDGITTLLGYRPAPLSNRYMDIPQAGLILECLGLIAQIDPVQQLHLHDFLKQVLHALENYQVNLPISGSERYSSMYKAGVSDLLFFFHAALKAYDGKLPEQFDFMCRKFQSLYYLALAWHILDRFSLAIDIL
jgi:predicted acylesterase/phospholipase RssA